MAGVSGRPQVRWTEPDPPWERTEAIETQLWSVPEPWNLKSIYNEPQQLSPMCF